MDWAHLKRIGLKPTEKLTLMAMAFHASRDGGGVFASVETLAREAEIGERSVSRALTELAEKRLVMVDLGGNRRGGRFKATRYSLAMPAGWSESEARKEAIRSARPAPGTAEPAAGPSPIPPQSGANDGAKDASVASFASGTPASAELGNGANLSVNPANLAPEQQEEQQEGSLRSPCAREPAADVADAKPATELVLTGGKLASEGERTPDPYRGKVAGDGFEAWWAAYPRKVGKGFARRAYAKAVKGGASPATLLDAVQRQRWPESRYIPYPATWLNGECWADDPDAACPVKVPPHPTAGPCTQRRPAMNGAVELLLRAKERATVDTPGGGRPAIRETVHVPY